MKVRKAGDKVKDDYALIYRGIKTAFSPKRQESDCESVPQGNSLGICPLAKISSAGIEPVVVSRL